MEAKKHSPLPCPTKFGVTQRGTGAFMKINLPSWEAAKKAAKTIGGIPCKYID